VMPIDASASTISSVAAKIGCAAAPIDPIV
jgi:hypothetical protein